MDFNGTWTVYSEENLEDFLKVVGKNVLIFKGFICVHVIYFILFFMPSRCTSNDCENAKGSQTGDGDRAEWQRLHLHDEDSHWHQSPLVQHRKGVRDDYCGWQEVKGDLNSSSTVWAQKWGCDSCMWADDANILLWKLSWSRNLCRLQSANFSASCLCAFLSKRRDLQCCNLHVKLKESDSWRNNEYSDTLTCKGWKSLGWLGEFLTVKKRKAGDAHSANVKYDLAFEFAICIIGEICLLCLKPGSLIC